MPSSKGLLVIGATPREWTRCLQVFAVTAIAIAVALSSSDASAQQSGAGRFKHYPRTGPIVAHRQPLSLLAKERVKVVVTMSDESVAEARALAPDHVVSRADHDAIQSRVAHQHASLEPAIASRGGRVLAHYHAAMNGMKIEIARGEIAGLSSLPGVVQVVPVPRYALNNTVSVPYIGAPAVWQGTPAFKGEHVKIAVIDTGIDYTHADFGGPGTVDAFMAAAATSAAPADPTMFGPNAPKVKGGIDLVGDDYDADNAASVPAPDPNPLDCIGHGSHVSGTAAGFGVANDGSTYHGPYNEAVYSTGFGIGPGVAPLADLYMVRVFGCSGTTDVVADAIEWAVQNDMDVISMSLGAAYGPASSSDSIAADNAAKAGIIVVAAAGNEGPAPYVTGDPGSATRAISVAAMNARPFLANGVHIAFSSGGGANGVEANSLPLPNGSVPAVVLTTSPTALGLGCNATDFPAGAAGALVILSRGTCSFVQKATNAEAAGAVAVGVVNNAAGFFSPAIDGVTIPFIELQITDAATFLAVPAGATASIVPANVPDTTFKLAASFSSGGPRDEDGALKPNVTAPGVNVFSVNIGSGNGGTFESGTSMATPHVAGVAALAVQAHRDWKQSSLRAAVVETASPTALPDYAPRIEGSGLVQAVGATTTDVTVHGDEDGKMGLLSFGVAELTRDYRDEKDLVIRNHGRFPAAFTATATSPGGVPHTVRLSSSTVSVHGRDETTLRMSLAVPAKTAGATHDANGVVFTDASGVITLNPMSSANHGVSLNLPYYLVTRARSNVDADLRDGKTQSIRLTNRNGVIAGNGDFYAWGLKNPKTGTIDAAYEPRAVGVQTNPISATDSVLVFAVNTYGRFSNPAVGEYDIYIDVNGDGVYDFILFSADVGAVELGDANGQIGTFLVDLASGALIPEFPADAPTDGSTVLMPVLASDLGISPTNPRFTYTVDAYDSSGAGESLAGTASFNAFAPAISNAMFVSVPPNTSTNVPVTVDKAELRKTPALGFMVVTEDNVSGGSQANLLKLYH
ncbi:MAG: S8 family serine peptidase [Gammaproteobacteria bacterium]